MINILPPELKQQMTFSHYNVRLVRYLVLILIFDVLLLAATFGSFRAADYQLKAQGQVVAARDQDLNRFRQVETDVRELQSSLNLIEKLFNEKTQFSALLSDLAAVMPPGSYINSIVLTGDDKTPLKVLISTNSITAAGVVRNGLLKSPRIKSADIQNIAKTQDSDLFTVDISIAFQEGQAR